MKSIFVWVLLMATASAYSQSVVGVWKTIDDEDGSEKSMVEIYLQEDVLYGKIIELLAGAEGDKCTACEGKQKDAPIVGMQIIKDMKQDGEEWEGGYIFDPKTAKEYRCLISLKDENTLKVRGYIGTPFLGRTQYWYRR